MKKILKPLALILFLSYKMTQHLAAQHDFALLFHQPELVTEDEVVYPEKGMPLYIGDKRHEAGTLEESFPKTAARFRKMYPAAESPVWIKEGNHLFAYFYNKGRKVIAVFSLKGYFDFAITQMNTGDVPPVIAKIITNDYASYSIFNVKQIVSGLNTVYQIILEGVKNFVTLYADDEEITSLKTMPKPGL